MSISSQSPGSGNHLTLDNTHAQQRVYQNLFLNRYKWLIVFHCHRPNTINIQLALLLLTVANPIVDVDPVDADVVAPIDDTNH